MSIVPVVVWMVENFSMNLKLRDFWFAESPSVYRESRAGIVRISFGNCKCNSHNYLSMSFEFLCFIRKQEKTKAFQ